MSLITLAAVHPKITPHIVEGKRLGRREARVLETATPAKPAVKLVVVPGAAGGHVSLSGLIHFYAWGVDEDGRTVPGLTITFTASDPDLLFIDQDLWAWDFRDDLRRAYGIGTWETGGNVNVTVASAGLPSIVVPVTVGPETIGQIGINGKPVGLWMTDPIRTAEAAADYALTVGHTGVYHEVDPNLGDRWYFLSFLQRAQDMLQRVIIQPFSGTKGVLGANGQFSVTQYLATWAKFNASQMAPFVSSGTLLGIQILGNPNYIPRWGRVITAAELRTIAAAVKASLPGVKVIVGGEPVRDGIGVGYSSADVDYAFPIYGYGKGPGLAKALAWADKMQTQSIAAGLGGAEGKFYSGMDVGDGGSGTPSSDPPGWKVKGIGQPATRWAQSPEEIAGYGKVLGDHPAVLSLLHDSYEARGEARYFARTDIQKAIRDQAAVYSGTDSGDPVAVLNVPFQVRVGDRVLMDTSGSGVPADVPWVRFIQPGDDSPVIGPLPAGAADPYHVYTAETVTSEEGIVQPTVWVVRLDTGQLAQAFGFIAVDTAPAAEGGHYLDQAPLPAAAVPTPAKYAAYLSQMGYRVYYLVDGHTPSAASPALNIDHTNLVVIQDGEAKVADVTFALDKVLVTNVRNLFTSVHGGRNDSAIWWRPVPWTLYTLAAGNAGKILEIDVRNLATTVVKDLFTDSRFRAAFGTTDRALSHLRMNGADLGLIRFAATVYAPSSGLPLGVVVWGMSDEGGGPADDMWFYKPPTTCAELAPERVRLDYTGRYLKVSLNRPDTNLAGCPEENDRSWQSMDLDTGEISDWVRDERGPWADDTGDNLTYGADGEGVKYWQIFPPQSPASVMFEMPRKEGHGNEYMAGMASAQAVWNLELTVGYTLGHGGLVGPWELYQGLIYRTLWTRELEDKPYRLPPDVVRRGYLELTKGSSLVALTRDQWWFDGQWLYVGLPQGTGPKTEGPEELQAFDWRFGSEEIILLDVMGRLKARLCHHHHRQRTNDPGHALAACQSYEGSRVTFTTNAGGQDKERVYCVLTSPGDSPYI